VRRRGANKPQNDMKKRIEKTLSVSDMLADGVTLEEFFDATDEKIQELFEKYPGPEVEITTFEDERKPVDPQLN
jgi:hypothetical protein